MNEERPSGYEPVAIAHIPRDVNGYCTVNLYVYLPTPKRFILFVPAGEKFTLARKTALERHIVPALFVKSTELVSPPLVFAPMIDPDESILDYEVIGPAGNQSLKTIFNALSGDLGQDPQAAVAQLEKMAEDIVRIVAPDVDDLKSRILENVQHVWVMNDASAIISIAALFASANGFDSQRPLRDIVYASLVMDLSLIPLGQDVNDQYYRDPESLPKDMMDKIQLHPAEAYRLAKQSLRYFTETAMQLILTHHEYKNGMGWPRKIRTETLSPLCKVFAAAVDAFERLKRSQMRGEAKSFHDVVVELRENGVEGHLRRHNREVIDKIVDFIGLDPERAGGGTPSDPMDPSDEGEMLKAA